MLYTSGYKTDKDIYVVRKELNDPSTILIFIIYILKIKTSIIAEFVCLLHDSYFKSYVGYFFCYFY